MVPRLGAEPFPLHLALCLMLEPDPKLVEHREMHKAKRGFALPVPSTCECGEDFPSKTALAEHQREVHPKEPPFDDALRERFLEMLRNGQLPNKSARALKITPHTVKRAMKVDPSFADAVHLAEEEAAEEIEAVLRERAVAGDPWAVKEWLGKRSKSRWADEKNINVNISGEIVHNAALLPHENDILALQQTVRERARLNGKQLALNNAEIIDAEILE